MKEPVMRMGRENWGASYIPTERLIGAVGRKRCKKCKKLCSEFVPSVGICLDCHKLLKSKKT